MREIFYTYGYTVKGGENIPGKGGLNTPAPKVFYTYAYKRGRKPETPRRGRFFQYLHLPKCLNLLRQGGFLPLFICISIEKTSLAGVFKPARQGGFLLFYYAYAYKGGDKTSLAKEVLTHWQGRFSPFICISIEKTSLTVVFKNPGEGCFLLLYICITRTDFVQRPAATRY